MPEYQVAIPIVSFHRRGLETTAELGFPEELELDENVSLRTRADESGETSTEVCIQLDSKNREQAKSEALSLVKDLLNILGLRSGMGAILDYARIAISEKTTAVVEEKGPGVFEAAISNSLTVSGALHTKKYLGDTKVFVNWYSESKAIHGRDDHFNMLLELYAMSWHETSARSRFLTLITIVEGLAPKPGFIQELDEVFERIGQLMETESSWLPGRGEEFHRRFNQFKSRLGKLKKESIKDSLKNLVSGIETEGDSLGSTVSEMYDLRSILIHGEDVPENVDMDTKTNDLRGIVEKLLSMRLDALLRES